MQDHRLALSPGFMIDNFRLERVLGRGGFGITYAAVDQMLGRRVAIKELLPDTIATRLDGRTVEAQSSSLQENWEWAKERFLEEARALATFTHPAIVGIQRLIEANGTVYIVMDYIEGESLEQYFQRTGPAKSQLEVMGWLAPILSGLEKIHAANLLHRDIKPDNILLRSDGRPILIDFGSARSTIGATMTMTSIVTHGYSPIEQYQTKGRMGPWSDIYALGAVVCRSITGEKPPVAADRIVEDDFRWLSHRGLVGFSKDFLNSVDWALRVKTQERPQEIAQFKESLFRTLRIQKNASRFQNANAANQGSIKNEKNHRQYANTEMDSSSSGCLLNTITSFAIVIIILIILSFFK